MGLWVVQTSLTQFMSGLQHILQFCSCPCFTPTIVAWPRALSDIRPRPCFTAASGGARWCKGFETGTNQRSRVLFLLEIWKMIWSWITYASWKFFVTQMLFCCSVTQSWRFVSQPDSHSCPEKMLTQSILLCILPASVISEVSKRQLAELCQEIIWALPSEIMPSE